RVIRHLALQLADLAHQLLAVLAIRGRIRIRAGRGAPYEGSAPVLRAQETLLLEPSVDRADGIHVDARQRGHLTHAWQLVARVQLAGRDSARERLRKLRAQRN